MAKFPTLDKVRAMLQSDRKTSPTVVRDMLGNRISEGMLLFWKLTGLTVEVSAIKTGGIITTGGDKTLGELAITVRFPFDSSMPAIALKDFIAVLNPNKAGGEDA